MLIGEIEDFREIRYLILPISFFYTANNIGFYSYLGKKLLKYLYYIFFLSILSIVISLVSEDFIQNQLFFLSKELIFICIPILSILLIDKNNFLVPEIFIKINLIGLTVYQVFAILLHPQSKIFVSISDFILNGVKSEVEGSLAFIYGLIVLYLYLNSKYRAFLISLFFLFLFGKRIVFFGIIISVILDFFLLRRISFKKLRVLLFSGFMLLTCLVVLFASRYFDNFFLDKFGLSLNAVTKGRSGLLNSIFEKLDYYSVFFGKGFGYTTAFLVNSGAQTNLVHSDLFRILVEFGFIGICTFYIFFYRNLHLKHNIVFAFFFLIQSVSDNIMIYSHVMFYYFIILLINNPVKVK